MTFPPFFLQVASLCGCRDLPLRRMPGDVRRSVTNAMHVPQRTHAWNAWDACTHIMHAYYSPAAILAQIAASLLGAWTQVDRPRGLVIFPRPDELHAIE